MRKIFLVLIVAIGLGSGGYVFLQHAKGEEGFSQATCRQAQEVIKKKLRDPYSAQMQCLKIGRSERLTSFGNAVASEPGLAGIREDREKMRKSNDPVDQDLYKKEIEGDYVQCLWLAVNAKNAFGGYTGEELWCAELNELSEKVVNAQPDKPKR
jgi:hypothetical protein